MSTAAIVSVEDYLHRTEKPYCEYVDGVLHPKAMAGTLHARAQYTLLRLLDPQGVEALAEVTVRITPTKYLIPDVIAAPVIQSPSPTEPVLLCVEILSPEDRVGAMLAKCEQYHAWGVPFCWVVDPESKPLGNIIPEANRSPEANPSMWSGAARSPRESSMFA